MGYFRTGERLDKKYILDKMKGNATFGDFVPDHCDPMKLSKNFLLTLVAYVQPELYKQFYNSYKGELQKKSFNKWSDFSININKNIVDDIKSFIATNENDKKRGGFRMYKNHENTNIFTQVHNIGLHHDKNQEQKKIIENQQNQISLLRNQNINNINKI